MAMSLRWAYRHYKSISSLISSRNSYFKVWNSYSLNKSQWFEKEELKELQLIGFRQLVRHARENTAYYKDIPNVNSIEDIKEWPILTKKDIRSNFNQLRAPRVKGYRVQTSGTVSRSITIKDDRLRYDFGEKRFLDWYRKPLGRRCWVWAMMDVGDKPKMTGDTLYLPIESLTSREEAVDYLKKIEAFKPNIIHGYSNALRFLAHYALQENIIPKVDVIQSNCEVLTEEARETMAEAFKCSIYNFYGSRELGSMAQDCEMHRGLHVNAERYIVEEIDGRLVFTDLLNYAMPLIRYENQDLGEVKDQRCECGRGLPLIDSIYGRSMDFLYTKKKTWLRATTQGIVTQGEFFNWVSDFQFKQEEQGKVTILLKPWSDAENIPNMDEIQRRVSKIYPSELIDIQAQIVHKMITSPSGKQIHVLTNLSPWSE